jgi:pilus assembly protein CpaB
MRAITITINKSSGLAGLVFPGDRVDILLTHQITDDNGIIRQVGETVFQNVRILAIDARTNDQANKPGAGKTATLEVTPKMAEKVAVVKRLGSLSLVLRSIKRPEGDEGGDMARDESMPISGAQTYSFDAEVSALSPPLDLGDSKQLVVISKGSQSQLVEFKRKEQ